ncbi:MAG: ABC transporter permease [Spirochaetales bacterium]|nr:ABC transporter permease [Spirochaetales bacterium]
MLAFFTFFRDIFKNRFLLFQLVHRDVFSQYKNSRLGIFWAFAEPLAFMGVLYLVFGIGLRGGRDMSIPFICYLVSGMSVVNLFSAGLTKSVRTVKSHSFLLKKVNFRLSLLPFSTVISEVINHFLFFIAVIIILFVNQQFPNWYWFQLFYYLIAVIAFMVGLSFFVSAIGVFVNDLASVISIFTRVLFYFTPVFWDYEMLPETIQKYVRLNPLFYIATGYRDSLFYNIPFWEKPGLTLYYWCWVLFFLILGVFTFRKLSPQFADYI